MKDSVQLQLSQKQVGFITWTLLLLMPIIGMAVDLIAPSLPAIAKSLQVSGSIVKNAISIYLLGYALGNFMTGFLADAWGRQKLIRINLASFFIASLLPIIFANIELILLARLLQGITLGAVAVCARATFSDILPTEKLVRLGPLIGAMWGLGPVIGPILGGYLQTYFGWKACFGFLALITLIGFIASCWVPETHFNRSSLKISAIKKNLAEIFRNKLFMGIVVLMGFAYSLLIVFNTMGPFLIQHTLQHSALYFGHVALYLGLIFLLSTFACRYFLKRYDVNRIYGVVINSALLVTLVLFGVTLLLKNNMAIIIVSSALMFFTCGFLFPMSMGKGASLFRHIAGTATAVMYLVNILITSLCSLLVSFVNAASFLPLITANLLLMAGCALIYWGVVRRSR